MLWCSKKLYLGKSSVDSGSEEYFGTKGQESNEIAWITVMGLEWTFSPGQHYDSTAVQTNYLTSLVKNNFRKHCGLINNTWLFFLHFILYFRQRKHCARIISISVNCHDIRYKYRWMINTGCKVIADYYCIVSMALK